MDLSALLKFASPAIIGLGCVWAVAGPVVLFWRYLHTQPGSTGPIRFVWFRTAIFECNSLALILWGIHVGQPIGSNVPFIVTMLLVYSPVAVSALVNRYEKRVVGRAPTVHQVQPPRPDFARSPSYLLVLVLLFVFIVLVFSSIGDVQFGRWMTASYPAVLGLVFVVGGCYALGHELRDRSLGCDSEDPVALIVFFLWIGGILAIAWLAVATELLPPLTALAALYPAWALGILMLAAALFWPGSRRQSRQAIPN